MMNIGRRGFLHLAGNSISAGLKPTNAGGGNVSKWIKAYGDPRSPKVDPIDWVERIPFSETRNYVQRVLENMQVYRAQLTHGRLMIEADLRRGAATN